MSPKEICSQLSHWIGNSFLKSHTFCLYFILFLHVWIRNHKAPEYGSSTDPDPQHWLEPVFCIRILFCTDQNPALIFSMSEICNIFFVLYR